MPILPLIFSIILTAVAMSALVYGGDYLFTRRRQLQEMVARGQKLIAEGQIEQAADVFRELRRTSKLALFAPFREAGFYYLGVCHEKLGEWALAERTYQAYLNEYGVGGMPGKWLDDVRDRFEDLGRKAREAQRSVVATEPAPEPAPSVTEPATPEPVTEPTAAPTAAPTPQLDADAIGPYVLEQKIGSGGFADVYKANLPVAVKVPRGESFAVDHERMRALARIESERIVRTLAVIERGEKEPPHIILQYVDGDDLRATLAARGGRLPPEEALGVIREVLLGLADAHREGVTHLDLKPENVLVDRAGRVLLTDFDLGRLSGEEAPALISRTLMSEDVSVRGTLAYMSPEQRDGKIGDHRSDIYTAGVMLFELLTGERPQPGDRPTHFVEQLAEQVDEIFDRAYTRLDRRYGSAEEMAQDIARALDTMRSPAATEPSEPEPVPVPEPERVSEPEPGSRTPEPATARPAKPPARRVRAPIDSARSTEADPEEDAPPERRLAETE